MDDFFEQEKNFLINYYNRIKDSCAKADKMTRSHKSKYLCLFGHLQLCCVMCSQISRSVLVSLGVADDYIHTAACLHSLALEEPTVIKK